MKLLTALFKRTFEFDFNNDIDFDGQLGIVGLPAFRNMPAITVVNIKII